MTLKIASFNVNSIKMRLQNVLEWLESSKTDIILMQETKTIDENFPCLDFKKKGFEVTFCGQKSYNGVAIASKFQIEEISRNLPYYDEITVEDNQARFLHVKIKNMNVICIYLPNGNPAPGDKYEYKISWMRRLIKYTREIYEKNEPIILGGDFNVIQSEIDCYDLSKWTNDALYLEPTRKKMKELINIGFIDSFRLLHPNFKEYSFWDYQAGAWQKDNGIRIDLFLISPEIVDRLLNAGIDKKPRGKEKPSDHTPIWIEVENI
ncbi:exodeoxyribonuclease III [Alphaproteobacteria bacterium]|nr:exodeoxyribonuclease III [Alphaproteobacteria bacterium]